MRTPSWGLVRMSLYRAWIKIDTLGKKLTPILDRSNETLRQILFQFYFDLLFNNFLLENEILVDIESPKEPRKKNYPDFSAWE